jgi:hypothetical protein
MFQDSSLQMLCTTTFILTAHAAQPDICLCLWLCPRQRNRCANSVPFITVNRLLKTWVSGCFSQIPYPGPSSYQTSRFTSLGRLNTTPRVASPGQTLRQSQVPYKTGQSTSHAGVLSVLALYSKQQHANTCWPIGPSQHVATTRPSLLHPKGYLTEQKDPTPWSRHLRGPSSQVACICTQLPRMSSQPVRFCWFLKVSAVYRHQIP